MVEKYKRLNILLLFMIAIACAIFFVLKALEEKIFFYSPTEILNKEINNNELIRVGGLVVDDSIIYDKSGLEVSFIISDTKNMLNISYKGLLPDLFREGQGIVAEGYINKENNIFFASRVLAKHDENYMPPEIEKMIGN